MHRSSNVVRASWSTHSNGRFVVFVIRRYSWFESRRLHRLARTPFGKVITRIAGLSAGSELQTLPEHNVGFLFRCPVKLDM